MYAVIFEVIPTAEGKQTYLEIAASLREFLEGRDGFISIETIFRAWWMKNKNPQSLFLAR